MIFVTDRTQEDVLMGKEKGSYSFTDLNRVEGNVEILAGELAAIGYDVSLQTKTDWGLPGDFDTDRWPVEKQMERYLRNIRTVHDLFPVNGQGRLPESMDKLTWETANLIERILENAHRRIGTIKISWKYSGEIFAGEE